MELSELTATPISVEVRCDRARFHHVPSCDGIASPLLLQLSHGYDECSVLPIPESVDDWRDEHRTARKRAGRAARLGYVVREVAREEYVDDVHAVNTSLSERQGRPMSVAYRERPTFHPLPFYPCPRHAVRTYGVLDDRGTLVSYSWIYRAGELALVSSILGHGEHLDAGVMYLLFAGIVERESEEPGFFVYNRHDSGTEGLRFFKAKLGFERTEVEWRP